MVMTERENGCIQNIDISVENNGWVKANIELYVKTFTQSVLSQNIKSCRRLSKYVNIDKNLVNYGMR